MSFVACVQKSEHPLVQDEVIQSESLDVAVVAAEVAAEVEVAVVVVMSQDQHVYAYKWICYDLLVHIHYSVPFSSWIFVHHLLLIQS